MTYPYPYNSPSLQQSAPQNLDNVATENLPPATTAEEQRFKEKYVKYRRKLQRLEQQSAPQNLDNVATENLPPATTAEEQRFKEKYIKYRRKLQHR